MTRRSDQSLQVPFAMASYRSQISRLRAVALRALKEYPISVQSVNLLNHGENTTFKVHATGNRQYVLRVHRHGYHTPLGLSEEFEWMDTLRNIEGLTLPIPALSRSGQKVVTVELAGIEAPRDCDLLFWVNGHFRWRGLTARRLFALGQMTAKIHNESRLFKPKIRNYWTAEGLLGTNATLGPFDSIPGASANDHRLIHQGRLALLKRLKTYEKCFPERLCMLHGDLHFGNLLWKTDGIGIIDFDDSGFGFRMYDLAVTCWMIKRNKKISNWKKPILSSALLEGYASVIPIDDHDRRLFDTLIPTRELVLLGWLLRRQDNPKLRPFLRKALRRNIRSLGLLMKSGE
jgi:Ser/Thr protein kinase RdoA (MazF antagonist)